MTSDKADRSIAQGQLDLVLGTARVSLAGLKPEEFDNLIESVLRKVDTRELRGFRPLSELLTRDFRDATGPKALNRVRVPKEIEVTRATGSSELNLRSHLLTLHRGVLNREVTYRRNESGEETNDWVKFNQWGPGGGYPVSATESGLFLRRAQDYEDPSANLYVIEHTCEKVMHKDEMIVTRVTETHVPTWLFRKQFGERYSQIARDMIWELSMHAKRTLDELRGKANSFEQTADWLERIGSGTME